LLLHRYKLQRGHTGGANDRTKTCRKLHDITNDRYFWSTLCSILESKPGVRPPFFEADNERSLDDLKRYTWNALRVHDAWLAPEPQFRFRTLKSPNLWRRTEVLPGGRWLFGLDDNQKALMLDLDCGTHYDLFKVYYPQDRLTSFQLSFKEGVRSSFRVALFNPRSWRGREYNGLGLMTFSIIILLQKYRASAFIKSIIWMMAILRSGQPLWQLYGILTDPVSGIPLKSQIATSSSVTVDGKMETQTRYCSFAILRMIPMSPDNLWRDQLPNKGRSVLRVYTNIV